jgi:hypothetical protein
MTDFDSASFELLVQKYLEGSLDDNDTHKLEAFLNDSNTARREFLQILRMHASIHVLLHGVGTKPVDTTNSLRQSGKTPIKLLRNTKHRQSWRWAAVAASVVLAITLFLLLGGKKANNGPLPAAPIAVVTVNGSPIQLERGGSTNTVAGTAEVSNGDFIVVNSGSSAKVHYHGEETYAELVGPCRGRVWTESQAPRLYIEGTAECIVEKQVAGRQFVVSAPLARVTVLGTRFRVESAATEFQLHVHQGKVNCQRLSDNRAVAVAEGESASIAKGAEFAAAPTSDRFLAGWWKLDELRGTQTVDAVHNIVGTLAAGVLWTKGKFGGAVSFTDKTAYIYCGGPNELNPQKMTLSVWMFCDASGMERGGDLISKETSRRSQYSLRIQPAGKLRVDIAGKTVFGKTIVSPGEWHHLAMTYDESQIRLYCDGNLDALESHTAPIENLGERLRIGGRAALLGIIDDVRIYNAALSEEQLRILFQRKRQ